MNLEEIKSVVDEGGVVHWKSKAYTVEKWSGDYSIVHQNGHAIGLTWLDGQTLNGKAEDFFVGEHYIGETKCLEN